MSWSLAFLLFCMTDLCGDALSMCVRVGNWVLSLLVLSSYANESRNSKINIMHSMWGTAYRWLCEKKINIYIFLKNSNFYHSSLGKDGEEENWELVLGTKSSCCLPVLLGQCPFPFCVPIIATVHFLFLFLNFWPFEMHREVQQILYSTGVGFLCSGCFYKAFCL